MSEMASPRESGRGRAPRQQRSEQTRDHILQAVISLLVSEGPGAVSHRRVAREAGVSLSATSYYFSGKQEMLASAYQRIVSEVRGRVDGLIERFDWRGREGREPLDPKAMADIAAGFALRRFEEGRDQEFATVELFLALARDEELRANLGTRPVLRDLMVDLLARAGSPHPEDDAEAMGALLQGLALHAIAAGDDAAYRERAARIAGRVFQRLVTAEA